MVRPRRTVPLNPPEPDLATIVANLQRQLLEQQQETERLRAQIAQMNQGPRINEVPPRAQPVPPIVPPVLEVQPEAPQNLNVPMAPVGGQANLQPVREDLLYERFRRMKAPEFEGPTDPIAADNWLIDIQVILDFMRLTEQEKVLCASFALKKDARHWWMTVQMRRDVTAMSWQDFQVSAGSSPPTLVSDCISRAIRAEYWINQDKEARAQFFKAKKEEKAAAKPTQPRQDTESYPKGQSSNPTQGPSIAQGRLEAPEPQARIYAYTDGNAEAGTSNVVTR
ncbi:hypothetical protein TIFTF001_051747 [Ficus carica]|uniref:Retrotransposon gag domain-containing protein n=1 Tax=Ficus carica TaxID=3494 RepID=A0AA87Z4I2_FICCA|nr:hypothetical protein TIFTF001_051747 [Ficus carica]